MDSQFSSKVKDMSLIFLGTIIIVVCLALFRSNMYIFTVFLCLYIGMYSIVIIIYLYKKSNQNTPEFNLIINVSMYSICLILCIIVYAIYLMMGSTNYRFQTRY